jgi:hypothetical protein
VEGTQGGDMNQSENTGYAFESDEVFSWNKDESNSDYQKIFENLDSLRMSCQELYRTADQDNRMLLEMMVNVLDGLERVFCHHFEANQGQIFSPKSNEPWD